MRALIKSIFEIYLSFSISIKIESIRENVEIKTLIQKEKEDILHSITWTQNIEKATDELAKKIQNNNPIINHITQINERI